MGTTQTFNTEAIQEQIATPDSTTDSQIPITLSDSNSGAPHRSGDPDDPEPNWPFLLFSPSVAVLDKVPGNSPRKRLPPIGSNRRPRPRPLGGDVVSAMARTPRGREDLLRRLRTYEPVVMNSIIENVAVDIRDLMVDESAVQFTRTVFQLSNDDQMISFVEVVVLSSPPMFIQICNDRHGVQSVLELMRNIRDEKDQLLIAIVVGTNLGELMMNENGHKVIAPALKYCPDDDVNMAILEMMAENCMLFATCSSGSCALRQSLRLLIDSDVALSLLTEIAANSLALSLDEFGNDVVQFVLRYGSKRAKSEIVEQLSGEFVEVAMDRFGCNVVETCLVVCEEDDFRRIIMELSKSDNFTCTTLTTLAVIL